MKEIEKELLEEKIQSRENWIKKAQSNIKLYKSEIEDMESSHTEEMEEAAVALNEATEIKAIDVASAAAAANVTVIMLKAF